MSDDGYAYARGSSRSKSAGEGGDRRHTRQERVDEVQRLEGDVVLLMKTIDQKQLKLQSASEATFVSGPRLQRECREAKGKILQLENQIKKTKQIIKKADSDKRKRLQLDQWMHF